MKNLKANWKTTLIALVIILLVIGLIFHRISIEVFITVFGLLTAAGFRYSADAKNENNE